MSTTTANLGLFKYDTTTDSASPFNINTALNNNWDIIDTAVGTGGSPTTVVSENTWYRQWSDGWKEQGGLVSLSETETAWTQPTLSANGTMGGSTFACEAIAEKDSSSKTYKMFDGNTSTNWCAYSSAFTGSVWFTFYNPDALKVTKITSFSQVNSSTGYNLKSGTIYGSNDNSTWVTLKTFSNLSLSSATVTITVNSTDYYKYHKVYISANQGQNQIILGEITVTATYKTSVANSITFPVSFNNTNYSYTFACQDGGGMDAYVSNKTTTGMTLSNTNSVSASWTACGY